MANEHVDGELARKIEAAMESEIRSLSGHLETDVFIDSEWSGTAVDGKAVIWSNRCKCELELAPLLKAFKSGKLEELVRIDVIELSIAGEI